MIPARPPGDIEYLLRPLAPEVLGVLVRRYGKFDASEDAVQDALLAATLQWPDEGVPDNPRAWLLTVASRRLIDELRGESSRRRREQAAVISLDEPDESVSGRVQLQAAIAAVHAEAPSTAETNWREITALYELLERVAPNPVFTLGRAVAVSMFRGPDAGLRLLSELERDERISGSHRVAAVYAHLLEMAGDDAGAAEAYEAAARLSLSLPEREYLQRRAAAAAAAARGARARTSQ